MRPGLRDAHRQSLIAALRSDTANRLGQVHPWDRLQLVEDTARAISTVSITIASSTCRAITSLALREIRASLVGPWVEFTCRDMNR